MHDLSRSRLLLSGLVAGMVIDAIQYLLFTFVFPNNWDALASLVSPVSLSGAAHPIPAATFVLTATKFVALLQLIGLAAGMLAVRVGTPYSRRKVVSAAGSAAIAWMFTFGLICVAIVLISIRRGPIDLKQVLMSEVGFALSGFVGCWAGSWFGNWVYRESEEVAAGRRLPA